jgi:hypothetical protein
MAVKRHPAHLYVCDICGERYVGYGDEDKEAMRWVTSHRSWHTAGIQEAGRYTIEQAPPESYMR